MGLNCHLCWRCVCVLLITFYLFESKGKHCRDYWEWRSYGPVQTHHRVGFARKNTYLTTRLLSATKRPIWLQPNIALCDSSWTVSTFVGCVWKTFHFNRVFDFINDRSDVHYNFWWHLILYLGNSKCRKFYLKLTKSFVMREKNVSGVEFWGHLVFI